MFGGWAGGEVPEIFSVRSICGRATRFAQTSPATYRLTPKNSDPSPPVFVPLERAGVGAAGDCMVNLFIMRSPWRGPWATNRRPGRKVQASRTLTTERMRSIRRVQGRALAKLPDQGGFLAIRVMDALEADRPYLLRQAFQRRDRITELFKKARHIG